MSSVVVSNGHDGKALKKRKIKYASPFRIKIGCLVAVRYQSRGNQVSVLTSDQGPSTSGVNGGRGDLHDSFKEQVTTAHFSEVWTDPRRGRDDGLALIGSRIRCFFSKTVLSEPYNAASRLLEGTVVNVVRDCEDQQSTHHKRFSSQSFMVDLLVDNKNDKTLSVTLPFLERLDNDSQNTPGGKILKESEQRRRQYEERIKGGSHKAVVRVSLTNPSLMGSAKNSQNPLEAKWVIRKRVPTKIVRRNLDVPSVPDAHIGSIDTRGEGEVEEVKEASENVTNEKNDKTTNEGTNVEKLTEESEIKYAIDHKKMVSPTLPGLITKNKVKNYVDVTTSFNKDFSLPRYLGDGNDSTAQQEGNWRWEAGRYHNPFVAVLAHRPISKALIEKLSYNFVGEVIDIHPMGPHTSKKSINDTLAMVTIRLLVLPEHTNSGRLAHHGPLDLFENDDIEVFKQFVDGGQKESNVNGGNNLSVTQQNLEVGKADHEKSVAKRCLLRVPIEELVIVERKIHRSYQSSKKTQETDRSQKEMIIKHSYSFLNDAFRCCKEEKRDSENSLEQVEDEKSGMQVCPRCRHVTAATRRLTGIPHHLCYNCFVFLKRSGAAKWGIHKTSKSKRYRCDCSSCVERKYSNLVVGLADEVLESESKLGSTLNALENYSAHRDSGFIATRFILKSMNPVDFAISPSSLASSINFASSKPVTKIKARVSKGTKNKSVRTSSNMDGQKRNGNKSPIKQGVKRSFSAIDQNSFTPIISKDEVFRSTSSRLLPYDVSNRKFDVSAAKLYQWKMFRSSISAFPEKPRNLRQHKSKDNGGESTPDNSAKKKLHGRAARAKQRRLLRSVSALGVDVDSLAGRETSVRFDRSNIHGWGVFTDIDIRQGEMIVEYRGELIGNAMAEKREKEYEAAKIGSDYMFRIDEYTVCDASKQGNVARFINASCSPNCYPKIIFLDGTKRVVVYAKRDIRAGEELCYDYKFDLEYDPAKRIPCICGAPECRGFLNWDQRYVALPNDGNNANSVKLDR